MGTTHQRFQDSEVCFMSLLTRGGRVTAFQTLFKDTNGTKGCPQVTGMVGYHINSDESDQYTYDQSNDQTMFRCSDHDPVIVGLRLDSTRTHHPDVSINSYHVYYQGSTPVISNAQGGYYTIYRVDGSVVRQSNIHTNEEYVHGLAQGLYIINIYGQGKCLQTKIIVPKSL